jgi:hypothetical protein
MPPHTNHTAQLINGNPAQARLINHKARLINEIIGKAPPHKRNAGPHKPQGPSSTAYRSS